ncbi:MAG: hypothetical protein R6X02_12415 [Enhygromyxa sp.]
MTGASLLEIIDAIRRELAEGATSVTLTVLDPDYGRGRFAGEPVEIEGRVHVHRPWRVWVELVDRLGLRMCTPRPIEPPLCELRFERLAPATASKAGGVRERYGAQSEFARIRKAEEPRGPTDLAYYRRYLQQHRRKVFVTGSHELLITAVADARAPAVH